MIYLKYNRIVLLWDLSRILNSGKNIYPMVYLYNMDT